MVQIWFLSLLSIFPIATADCGWTSTCGPRGCADCKDDGSPGYRECCGPGPGPTPGPFPTPGPSGPEWGTPVEMWGRLSVKGNQIVDKNGQPVRLAGMSMFWSIWGFEKFWNKYTVNWLHGRWNVHVIRAAMAACHDGGYPSNPGGQKAHIEAVVDACIEAGIYVVIDWHCEGLDPSNAGMEKQFMSEMAQKYGDKPNVMFETFNEPTTQDWSGTIKPYHEQIIPAIRQHSQNIIILGTRSWSQEVDTACSDRVQGENLAYTLHFYAATHHQDLRNRASKALSMGCALFVTEWGTCEASGTGRLDFGEASNWMDFLDQNHISSTNWGIYDKPESCAALSPGASAQGGWDDGAITQSGKWVRDRLLKQSYPIPPDPSTPTPAPPTPPPPTPAPSGSCDDESPLCPGWAQRGECKINPWMLDHCQKSCGTCPPSPPSPPSPSCEDEQEACKAWAAGGECQNNPSYMLGHCKKSCGNCPKTEVLPWVNRTVIV